MTPSPTNITSLKPHEVFVFGANEAARHGAGAAKQALQWGAKMGRDGLCGQTYGICTKDRNIKTLPLERIEEHVHEFLYEAERRPGLTFLCTEIGCGLAGLKPAQIAPMFGRFKPFPKNVRLPQSFINIIEQ